MSKFYSLTIKVLLFLSLTGCIFPTIEIKIPDYSLGPVSSHEFPTLLHNAIPASEGEVHVFGRVEWYGLRDSPFRGFGRHFRGVAAITNTDILLLKWHEPGERYKIVERLPYSEILSVSTSSWGSGGSIHLHLKDKELSLGDQNYGFPRSTYLGFVKPSGFWTDQEKNEAAFVLLQEKIKPQNSDRLTPDQSFDDDY